MDTRMRAAGKRAEDQMAFYLNRDLRSNNRLHIIHDLRVVDPDQPEHNGLPGVCQIDHLVLHQHGAFIIESKSVSEEITVRPLSSGGDQWTRRYQGRNKGFPSPIKQAERQAALLRNLLQDNKGRLRAKMSVGLRTVAKALSGTDQRGFRHMPIQIIAAISDNGSIKELGGWKPPQQPFRSFLCKADSVSELINEELNKHRAWLTNTFKPDASETKYYGLWSMKPDELNAVHAFLQSHNTPKQSTAPKPTATAPQQPPAFDLPAPQTTAPEPQPRPPQSAATACKACNGPNLTAKSGRYGYYWACNDCNTNTAMPATCEACGQNGKATKAVRIRKDGPRYFRDCQACGIDQLVWRESAAR
ncbi:MAG: NERD domain-containing protein [Planctomycetota bacterium]